MSENSTWRPSGILFGAAYYAEYHLVDRVEQDLDLMVEAGFSVIRVGESVWSTWEPREGEYDLDWLEPVLDAAQSRGIKVILGTPTYAVPPWLQQAYPEIAAERSSGSPIGWGARQEVDYSHPAYLFHAERVIRRVIARYAGHPSVIGFQVDNEPGLELFHNHGAFTRFVRRLKQQYGDVDTLNREWGLTYWSHRIADWSELWRPDGNSLPQYDLAWRRYQADLTTEFIDWQASIVREYARPEQFVTTCINYPRLAHDDRALGEVLDVISGNPYYSVQDHLDFSHDLDAQTTWTTSGVAGLVRQADRLYSSQQARFLVTETNAQSIDGPSNNQPPWPGQLQMAAFTLISRGAAMVEYWHWHSLPFGTETYWGGVLPHSLEPGRVYHEVSDIGAALAEIGTALDGFEPDADVALLWSNDSRWAMQFFPPLNDNDVPVTSSYERIFDAFHRGVVESGAQARIVHSEQVRVMGAADLARRFPVLIAAGILVADDQTLQVLVDYAAAGGHLIIGPRTGYGDAEARARIAVAPALLREAAGVKYAEFANIAQPVAITSVDIEPGTAAAATKWIDGLVLDGADKIASYVHPFFSQFAAVATHGWGEGTVTTVGTIPDRTLARALVSWAAPDLVADQLAPDRALPVTVASGTRDDGRRAWFVFNWSWQPQALHLSRDARNLVTGSEHHADGSLELPPWSSLTLLDSQPSTPASPIIEGHTP